MTAPVAAAHAQPTSTHMGDGRALPTRCISASWPPVSPSLRVHPTFLGTNSVTRIHLPAYFRLPPAGHRDTAPTG
jgi:hypothetical protein